jgi:hypothetical protein
MIRKIIKIDKKNAPPAACVRRPVTRERSGSWTERQSSCARIYCDGLGDCLPACPAEPSASRNASQRIRRDRREEKQSGKQGGKLPCGCPGTQMKRNRHESEAPAAGTDCRENESRLPSGPSDRLLPVNAPFFQTRSFDRGRLLGLRKRRLPQ